MRAGKRAKNVVIRPTAAVTFHRRHPGVTVCRARPAR
jgi:hypothetical protein